MLEKVSGQVCEKEVVGYRRFEICRMERAIQVNNQDQLFLFFVDCSNCSRMHT